MLSKTKLKQIAALKHKRGREKSGLFLIEGKRLCEEAVRSDHEIEICLIDKKLKDTDSFERLKQIFSEKDINVIEIDEKDANQIAETVHSQGIFCVVRQKKYDLDRFLEKKPDYLLAIDAGQDPGNVGTLIRTADWFGFDGVLLGKGTVETYNAKLLRATMGSFFHLPVFSKVDLYEALRELKIKNFQLIAADVHADSFYHQINYEKPIALVLGNENKGLSPKISTLMHENVKIPAYGKSESLNLAQAGAIIMSQIRISQT